MNYKVLYQNLQSPRKDIPMKIVSFKICPFVQRVTTLLETKSAIYDIEYIDLSHKPKWFMDISPNGQVPILITDDNAVLFESDAIVEYLEEVVTEPLLPADPVKKAQSRAWSYLASKHYLVQCSAQRSSNAALLEERAAKLSSAFAKISTQLGDSPFINGRSMGMVDVAWAPLLHRAAVIEDYSGYDFLTDFPRLKMWQKAILATDIPKRSVPEDFNARFTAFYLSESTYLGQLTREKRGQCCSGKCECTVEDLACCA